jgi:hypothetical protein
MHVKYQPFPIFKSHIDEVLTNEYKIGKVFVREWARLRYGVFEEHGYTGADDSFPMFYRGQHLPSKRLI